MLFDTHLHCEYSTDSTMTFKEAREMGEKRNLGIIVTEHWDYDYPTNPEAFLFDLEEYFAKYGPYRSKRVLLGLEMGLQPQVATANGELAARFPFDCVIGSVHCVKGRDLYEATTYEGLKKATVIAEYLREIVRNLELFTDFDIFGHLDYICRYLPYEDKELYYEEFPHEWDEVFRLLIAQGKVPEINTRRLDSQQAVTTLLVLYRRYAALGGRYVSLGSDAHDKEHIGRNFEKAQKMAEECRLQPVYFCQRKMALC